MPKLNIRQPEFGAAPDRRALRRTEHARKQANARNRRISTSRCCPGAELVAVWALGSPKTATVGIAMAGAATPPLLRIGVLALLVLQNTSLRLVMKHASTVSPNFSATAAVFCCVGSEIYNSDRRARAREAVPYDGFSRGFELSRTTPMLVPAALYLLADRLHHVSADWMWPRFKFCHSPRF